MNDDNHWNGWHWLLRTPAWVFGLVAFFIIALLGIAIAYVCEVLP